jgi:hypothetical protein
MKATAPAFCERRSTKNENAFAHVARPTFGIVPALSRDL